jgi:hypothetical protein
MWWSKPNDCRRGPCQATRGNGSTPEGRKGISRSFTGNRKVEAVELDQLAKLYGRPVNFFLSGETKEVSEKVAFYARTFKDLSEKDLDEVARFAEFLRASGTSKKATTRKPK